MKTVLSLILSMSVLSTACQQLPSGAAAQTFHEEKTLLNQPYGKDPAQKMDIYLPAGRNADSTKSLILIHGGGWNSGSKSDFLSYIDSFRRRMPEYAVFNLEYRLFNGKNTFPAQEEDITAAVRFISEKATEFGIDTDRFVLLGASAGGHLALLQAYKNKDPKIAAVIDFFGPTDLTTMYNDPWHSFVPYALQTVTGTTPQADPELYRQWSPLQFVNRNTAPTLILHGTEDPVVDISQSKLLAAALKKHGVKHELVAYPGLRHGWRGSNLSHSFNRIENFLRTNLK
jgi:acetyl esterase/lipase